MKKILIAFVCSLLFFQFTYAENTNLEKLFLQIEKKPLISQKNIYKKYIKQLNFVLTKKNYQPYFEEINSIKKQFEIKEKLILEKLNEKKISINSHNTLILKFNNWINIDNYIQKNKTKISTSDSVFIFREKYNISSKNMKIITKKLKEINPSILIFIDQEWWLVNRFISFEWGFNIKNYESDTFVSERYSLLTSGEKNTLLQLFWKKYYFPSMKSIWNSYKNISDQNKKEFLEIISYIQLKNLQNHGINTHGIIGDLDLWNPVISGLSRSFSQEILDYFKLIDAYTVASKEVGIMLYLKHFPGHGSWKIDSHKWILDYSHNTSYVKKNLIVFEYFLSKETNLTRWIMVGHMFLNKNISESFHKILEKSDFVITDDLAMNGYRSVKSISENKIFTTKELENYNNVIKVHTQINIWIK